MEKCIVEGYREVDTEMAPAQLLMSSTYPTHYLIVTCTCTWVDPYWMLGGLGFSGPTAGHRQGGPHLKGRAGVS